MLLKIKDIKLLKLDFETFSHSDVESGEPIKVKIDFNFETSNISKITDDKAKLVIKFICHMEAFCKYQIDLESQIISKDIDTIITTLSNKQTLPPEAMSTLINSYFYFVMPEIVLLAEKAKIPIPIPPLFNPKQMEIKRSKSKAVRKN